jgi:hypothetical protein
LIFSIILRYDLIVSLLLQNNCENYPRLGQLAGSAGGGDYSGGGNYLDSKICNEKVKIQIISPRKWYGPIPMVRNNNGEKFVTAYAPVELLTPTYLHTCNVM